LAARLPVTTAFVAPAAKLTRIAGMLLVVPPLLDPPPVVLPDPLLGAVVAEILVGEAVGTTTVGIAVGSEVSLVTEVLVACGGFVVAVAGRTVEMTIGVALCVGVGITGVGAEQATVPAMSINAVNTYGKRRANMNLSLYTK
jgi:hypothetical protein